MRDRLLVPALAIALLVAAAAAASAARPRAASPRAARPARPDLRVPANDARGWMPDVARRLAELEGRHARSVAEARGRAAHPAPGSGAAR